jgi:nucleoid-associated protein YgaU
MVNGIRNALLFGGGALVAALAVAYGSGAFAPAPMEKVAQTAEPAGNSTTAEPAGNAMTAKEGRVPAAPQKPAEAAPDKATTAPASQAKADKPASTNDADSKAATAGNMAPSDDAASANEPASKTEAGAGSDKSSTGTKDVTAPSFDVVRVEGNGSIVVAGRSTPGAKVEILSGKNVLGASTAGGQGDFAIVLDDPLKPGDYQLVLRSTTPANVVAMSKETAVVSIPEHQNGQVLALVEAPGQPSKLITVPKPEKAEVPAPAAPSGTAESAGANPPVATGSSGGAAAPSAPAAGSNAGAGQETAAAGTKPSGQGAAAGAGQTSAQAPADQAEGTQPATTAKPEVSVEAVEIEGNKIFVAGVADPGSTVRVYANETVLGEAKTSPVGRFLVESIHELAVGDYIIRADMLGPDGLKVAARAAVPFTRAPGESVAAVASGEAGSAKSGSGAAGAPAAGPAGSGTAAPTGEAGDKAAGATANSTSPAALSSSSPAVGDSAGQAVASDEPGSTVLPPLGNAISKEPPTVLSPKLEETTGAVIIRRGDTLWQISRRVYGHGVRYSTIYLANQDQIENPDLIWPGQIFAVPNETKEGDTANMKAIAGQATEVPKKATE